MINETQREKPEIEETNKIAFNTKGTPGQAWNRTGEAQA